MSAIRLVGHDVNWGGGLLQENGHLQLVLDGEREIEVRPWIGAVNWYVPYWSYRIDSTLELGSSPQFGPELDIGDRTADDVWEMLMQSANSMTSVDTLYVPLNTLITSAQNSNTFINTLLYTIGISTTQYAFEMSLYEYEGVENNLVNNFTFNIRGTVGNDIFRAGAKDDIIAGGAGADDLDGGGGADILVSGDPRSSYLDAQNSKGEKLNGGEGSDYIVLTPDSRIADNPDSEPDVILQKGDSNDRIFISLGNTTASGEPLAAGADVPIFALLGGGYGYIVDGPADTAVDPDKNLNYDSFGEINRIYSGENANYDYYFETGRLVISTVSGLQIVIEDFEEGDYGIHFMSPVIIGYQWIEDVFDVGQVLHQGENAEGLAALAAFQNGHLTYKLRTADNTVVVPQQRFAALASETNSPAFGFLIEGDSTSQAIAGNDIAETISGGEGNDVIRASGGDDTILGDEGNDRLIGGADADVIDGGSGVDTADFRTSSAAVVVNLWDGSGLGGDAEGDTIFAVENLAGSDFADSLTGDANVNRIQGMDGADSLFGGDGNDRLLGGEGADLIDGGAGVDTADYSTSLQGVTVNLTTLLTSGGDAAGDSFVSVENLSGSDFADSLTGDAGNNRLSGVDGDDILSGMAGIDYLVGGAGDDTMTGGTQADVFVIDAGGGHDTITDFWAGAGRTDRIQLVGTGLASFAQVAALLSQTGQGAVLSLNGGADSILFSGVSVAALVSDDFIYA